MSIKEERSVNFKSISATNVKISEAIKEIRFREDLYYRISKFKIEIPSLNDRREDIPELIQFILQKNFQGQIEISKEAIEILMNLNWQGNIRELENIVENLGYRAKNYIINKKLMKQLL